MHTMLATFQFKRVDIFTLKQNVYILLGLKLN